ncbi:cyclin-SDS-like [Cocos nucifera]|uniref:Cyclin-SDS-like n=1 Tax=Cocos nucifera TaxID=13894 RepID=A0A8K0I3F0_COCNU|nr:cyclin-SDS-like [Cocos nucifera]
MPYTGPDQISQRPISGRKRPIEAVPHARKLRSKISRRRRIPLLPIVDGSLNAPFNAEDEAESSSSCLRSDISSESSLVFGRSGALKRPRSPRRRVGNSAAIAIGGGSPDNEYRRISKTYARRRERLRSAESKGDGARGVGPASAKRPKMEENTSNATLETSVSDVSEVIGGFPDGNLKHRAVARKAPEKDPDISESSCLEFVSEAITAKIVKSAGEEGGRSQISQNFESRGEEPRDRDLDSDLACSEEFSSADGGSSEYSTCNELTLSELEAEFFPRSSDGDSSEYSLSVLADSSSDEFSEESCENSAPSATFSLFLQFAQQFSRSRSSAESNSSYGIQEDSPQEFTLMRFEAEEDEESYKRFRSRERNEAVLQDYSESTDYGDLILEQRLQMVNWIMEHANAMELQGETLFLGVSLMDRFLSRGYFKNERNLQLLGIACITLATRIEENQPYNSIRQRCFKVANNVYSRSEVVAMEWFVQEVLKFKCFLPTIHHFLWFYLKAAGADSNVENLSRHLALLSLLNHERLCFKTSTVAAGVVILACLATNHESSCLAVMETHVRTKNDDLPECIQLTQKGLSEMNGILDTFEGYVKVLHERVFALLLIPLLTSCGTAVSCGLRLKHGPEIV